MSEPAWILFDAGIFIGALLRGDPRHFEAHPLVEAARHGDLPTCTTIGILSEVYAVLTWERAVPPHTPAVATEAVRLLIEPPSAIHILSAGRDAGFKLLELVQTHQLTARRTHDARHAATAITSGVTKVYTYDIADWRRFHTDGLEIAGPPSTLLALQAIA